MSFSRYTSVSRSAVLACGLLLTGTALSADTWQASGLAGQTVFVLARDAAGVVYAGTWFQLHQSTDSGQTWTVLPDLPLGTADVFGLAVNPVTQHLFVAVEPGVYRSEDGGNSWNFLDEALVGAYHIVSRWDGLLLVSGSTGTFRSTDHGDTWDPVHATSSGTSAGDALAILASGEFLELNHESLYRSSSQGQSWTDVGAVRDSGAMISSFAVDRVRDLVYRADHRVIDSLFRIGYQLYRSFDQGESWERADSGKYTVPEPLFCDSRGVVWTCRLNDVAQSELFQSTDSGSTWVAASAGLPPGAGVQCFLEYAPGLLLAGTIDGGIYRLAFSPDSCCLLPGDANNDSAINSGDAITLINYAFKGGPKPACPAQGDVNDDGNITAGDVVSLINFVFRGGAAPVCGSAT